LNFKNHLRILFDAVGFLSRAAIKFALALVLHEYFYARQQKEVAFCGHLSLPVMRICSRTGIKYIYIHAYVCVFEKVAFKAGELKSSIDSLIHYSIEKDKGMLEQLRQISTMVLTDFLSEKGTRIFLVPAKICCQHAVLKIAPRIKKSDAAMCGAGSIFLVCILSTLSPYLSKDIESEILFIWRNRRRDARA